MTRILVVEDEMDLAEVLRAVLEDEGYGVDTASNGKLALDRIAAAPPPDLLLVDVMMPVMSGDELVASLSSSDVTRQLPVVMMSAVEPSPASLDHARAFLRKPFSIDALVATLADVLRGRGAELHD